VLGTGSAGPLTGAARANFRRDLAFQLLTGVFLGVVLNFYPVVARRLGASEFILALLTAGSYLGALLSLGAPYVLRTLQPARRIALIWATGRALWRVCLIKICGSGNPPKVKFRVTGIHCTTTTRISFGWRLPNSGKHWKTTDSRQSPDAMP